MLTLSVSAFDTASPVVSHSLVSAYKLLYLRGSQAIFALRGA